MLVRRKRLKHDAFILCHMFCGWRLVNCYDRLVVLGTGTLEIDALTTECRFNAKPVEPLSIAGELHFWLRDDLASQGLSMESIRLARLEVHLELSEIDKKHRLNRVVHFEPSGHEQTGPVFHRCSIACRAELATDEAVYVADCKDVEEWPVGWPIA